MANWGISVNGCDDPNGREPGHYVNGVVSINGGPAVPCVYGRDQSGDPMYLCIPSLPTPPPPGTPITATNPSGNPGDPGVKGNVDPNGDITLKAIQQDIAVEDQTAQ